MKSFLDDIADDGKCHLICHDQNHNLDFDENGCGNPDCWKWTVKSPSPRPERSLMCRCPYGTFRDERIQ